MIRDRDLLFIYECDKGHDSKLGINEAHSNKPLIHLIQHAFITLAQKRTISEKFF
jgi:hypothetical protein